MGGTQEKLLLHLVNLESVRDFEDKAGLGKVDPVRFRPNLVWEGGKAWEEWEWCGQHVRVGEKAVLEFIEPTIRCPATQVRSSDVPLLALLIEANCSSGTRDAQWPLPSCPMRLGVWLGESKDCIQGHARDHQ